MLCSFKFETSVIKKCYYTTLAVRVAELSDLSFDLFVLTLTGVLETRSFHFWSTIYCAGQYWLW